MPKKKPACYKRILLKLSGEALQGEKGFGIDPCVVLTIARQIREVQELGVEIAVVVGGGNIFRGVSAAAQGMDRSTADYIGMLATMINALGVQDGLEKSGVYTRVLTALEMKELAEPYIRRRAVRHLEKGRVVVFAGGTGNPYFTTDTTAALRAVEIGADIILKATKVDGVYDKDPLKYKGAKKFKQLSYIDAIRRRLKVMDSTALTLCMDNNVPIVVFDLNKKGNIKKAVTKQKIGTLVT